MLIPGILIATGWVTGRMGIAATSSAFMTVAAVIAGVPIAKEAWQRLRLKRFSIPLLITVASVGALWIGEAWEAAVVTFLFRFGGYLEGMTLNRTRAALRELLDLRPLTAKVRGDDGEWHEIPAEQVEVGSFVLIRPGDRVPVDGTVRAGQANLDTAALTGEPLPKEVGVGDSVLSGSVSRGGYLEVEAERVASQTTFQRLIRLVAQAQNDKPKVQRFLDRFAQVYTPLVLAAAAVLYLITRDGHMSLTFLVIACPGALVVAAPVAVVAGLGRAARMGILIKGGERLELVGRINTVAFDKTGTLTKGRPTVSDVTAFAGDPSSVLQLAATAEARSEHHLANAITTYAAEQGIKPESAESWELHAGLGVEAVTDTAHVLVGNRRFLESRGVPFEPEHEAELTRRAELGEALALVAANGALAGVIGIHDPVRPAALDLVPALKRAGVDSTVMLTGDHAGAAAQVANRLGIGTVRSGLLPEEKVDAVKELQSAGRIVAMVGDGINDAPALATADVSIAMGASGTQVAMESADIVLVEDRLDKVPMALELSRRILRIVRQNVAVAVGTVLILLAGVVSRHVGLGLGMLVHQASVLAVILNGMRLLRVSGEDKVTQPAKHRAISRSES